MRQLSGVLQVNLTAIRANWQLLRSNFNGDDCAAVVKANAYGLGVKPVVRALFSEGCRTFFVATYDEGVEVRSLLPDSVNIYVLQGCAAGMEFRFFEANLIPVLISFDMYTRWLGAASGFPAEAKCALKVNTGMNRLGMSLAELEVVSQDRAGLMVAGVELLVSHLACADEPSHELNHKQLLSFELALECLKITLPNIKASLVNSAGIFLGQAWQFDIARPGIGLFGGVEASGVPKFSNVVSLYLPVLQVRGLCKGESVGYGALWCADHDMRIAIVSGGYGDGVLRSLSCLASGWFNQEVPMLGRVSMDSCVFDVSALAEADCPREGDLIEVIGDHRPLCDVAEQGGTISYEFLTRLGGRLEKIYCE